jgi:hypothetical protein
VPHELSPFELDRELSRVAPRVRAAYRAVRSGREVRLSLPDVLLDPETHERLRSDTSDPIAAPLLRWIYWLELAHQGLSREGARVRSYRAEHHALDAPLSGHFTWRELLGHALRDRARRPALLEVMLERGDELRDQGSKLIELRAERPRFVGQDRAELELPSPDIAAAALAFLKASSDASSSLGLQSLSDVLEQGLAHDAADGWPRQLSLRSLNDLLGEASWLKSLRLELGDMPAALSAASFARGFLRLGAAWSEALVSPSQPFCIRHDPFGLSRAQHGALFASIVRQPTFLKRQLGLGKERSLGHCRALSRSALIFARLLALRVLQDAPSLEGPRALREALAEHAPLALGFELPPEAAGLFFRPRLGDAQRLAGWFLAAAQAHELADEHDEDWFRNPRAIEQLRAEGSSTAPPTTCSQQALEAGVKALTRQLSEAL